MNSSLYQCRIFHKRLKPVTRQFAYSVFMMSIDLDELDKLNNKHWLFSRNRWNIYSIKDADYLTEEPQQTIKEKLFIFLTTQGIDTNKISKTTLQTFPRIFGYQFNPVSFYYLEDTSGKTIATVAEVGNTFLEKKLFLINQSDKPEWFRLNTAKNFYVSPFSKVTDHFDFQIGPKNQNWSVNINDLDEDGIVLVSTIRGKQKTFSSIRLSWYIIRYPLLTTRIIFLIHWHALIMWIRKLPISNKTTTGPDQTNVLRPHKSLTKKITMANNTLEATKPAKYVWQQKIIHKLFSGMPAGGLLMRYSDGATQQYGAKDHKIEAEINLNDDNEFFRRCVAFGNVGLGEAYMDKVWDTPDIKAVITWFIRNMKVKEGLNGSSNKLKKVNKMKLFNKLFHAARANTIRTSKKNISEHYDLGNDFYKLFLDPSMTYSSGIFSKEDTTLEEAQFAKYDALCKKLQLKEGDEVLEIGCGWGGFACHAATHYGCNITGVTISQEQLNYAIDRVKKAGLEKQIDLRLQDYREITGSFDHIVSIEMLEAVGDKFLPGYFTKCNELLKPEGALGIQIITVPDSRYDQLKRGVDFIQRHIFPGSLLLSLGRINQVMKRTGELTTFQIDDMGIDYAKTLSEWHVRFNAELDNVKAQGFDETFIRKWNYYLKYCEAAFATRNISVVQAIYTKPNNEKLTPLRSN